MLVTQTDEMYTSISPQPRPHEISIIKTPSNISIQPKIIKYTVKQFSMGAIRGYFKQRVRYQDYRTIIKKEQCV